MTFQKVGVVGAGTMGAGIAQVFAASGTPVVLNDIAQEYVDKGLAVVSKGLGRLVKKEKMTQDAADEIVGRIQGSTKLDDLAGCDLVVEAIIEDKPLSPSFYDGLKVQEVVDAALKSAETGRAVDIEI